MLPLDFCLFVSIQLRWSIIISSVSRMGSRITRAFSITDRQRRVHPSSQQQVKSFIKAMSASMFGFLIFGLGLLTSHSSEAHQHCLELLAIAAISALVLNATNQQFCLICGWLMVVVQTLFLGERLRLMFGVGQFLVIYAVFTNLFNYYAEPAAGFLKFLKPSGLVIMGSVIFGLGHCSSHFIKQMRAEATGESLEPQLNFELRFVLCFLGIMVVALTVMGHVHIRSRRFLPISLGEQAKFIFSINTVTKIEIILFLIGLRSLMLNMESLQKCISGGYLVLIFMFAIGVLIAFGNLLHFSLFKLTQPATPKQASFITLTLLVLSVPCYLLQLPYPITYPLSIILLLLLLLHLSIKIQNDLRINYILAFIVAIVCEANNIQHIHGLGGSQNYVENCAVAVLGVVGALGVGFGVGLFGRNGRYRQVGTGEGV